MAGGGVILDRWCRSGRWSRCRRYGVALLYRRALRDKPGCSGGGTDLWRLGAALLLPQALSRAGDDQLPHGFDHRNHLDVGGGSISRRSGCLRLKPARCQRLGANPRRDGRAGGAPGRSSPAAEAADLGNHADHGLGLAAGGLDNLLCVHGAQSSAWAKGVRTLVALLGSLARGGRRFVSGVHDLGGRPRFYRASSP